jgi:branched-chain amino acid aminotransferase group I
MATPAIDPRNADLQVWVGDRLLPRAEARVSVFDSVVQGGDAVWEGLRVYRGRVFALDAHLDRLLDSARALAFAEVPARERVTAALFATLRANGMRDEVHVRLTLTRGEKVTSGMSPAWNQAGPTLIVLAEWKPPLDASRGQRLVTSAIRRNPPSSLDSRIHHANLLNNILAKLQAKAAGADDAVMLDAAGFVAETNATNLFLVKRGALATPRADSCLPGITRGVVLELAAAAGIPARERNLTLGELWSADEVFTTGTMNELAPVAEVDGRRVGGEADGGEGAAGPVTRRLQELYAERTGREGTPLPDFPARPVGQ